MSGISVLIVDDQTLVRTGLRMILETENGIEVVGEAANGRRAITVARELRPDVILMDIRMDIRMPEMDGISATRSLVHDRPDGHCRVLILTTFDLDEYVYEALRAGASGFLLKDAPPEELVHAIRVVAVGEALLAPSVTRRLIEDFAAVRVGPGTSTDLTALTDREVDVLRQLATGKSNVEIADALFVSETTVKTHISHILTKLELRDRVQAVVVAYESGLVQPGSPA
jgi:DNA-binding NarL/FixJ family response regulator